MTSESSKSFTSVKDQIEKMFEMIHNSDSNDKIESFELLRKCLGNENFNTTSTDSSSKFNVSSQKSTETAKPKRNTRNNYRKVKFKNHTRSVKKAVLKCRICGVLNKTKSLLLKHLETHIGTPISCKHCKKEFNNRPSFLCHISLKMCKQNKTVPKKYSCDQCPKIFRFKRHFERHVEGHKRNNCTYCDARLTRREALVHHLLSVHSIKLERAVMFKCEHCEKRYVKKRSLYHHLKQHAENKIVCMECGWISSSAEDHAKHFNEHDKDRPWKCEKCNDRFSRRQQYLIHMKRHDRYKCVSCNETFASKSRVLRHKQRGHTVQGLEPQMKCPHCPMAFQRRLTLQIHMKKHLDDKLMYCKYCDKNFRSPYLYFKHCATTVHEINSPDKQQLVCEICGKLFVKKYQLEQHLHRVHDHTKQAFTCEFCGHKTTNKTNMDRHLSLHLEDKKEVICEQCGKAFYNITTLKDHISYVHSQERHFKCDQCNKAFKRNSELIRHKTSHSELRPHVCQICGVSYKRSTHLRRHEESQHGSTSKNRRVQRLTKDINGDLIPIPNEKKNTKSKKNSRTTPEPIFSIMDVQFGEMVTFTLPDLTNTTTDTLTALNINNQQLTTVELPNLILNSADNIILSTDQSLNLVNSLDSNFISNDQFSNALINNSFISDNVVQQPVTIQNSTTCDILLPDNRIVNLQSEHGEFSQNPYHFL